MEKLPESQSIIIEIIKSPILSAIVGAITATFLSPYIKWGIEKKRLRRENRSELLSEIRTELNSNRFSVKSFRDSEILSRVRPNLSKTLKDKIWSFENDVIHANSRITNTQIIKEEIFQELSDLEKKWKLI